MGAEWTATLMLCGIYSMTAIATQLGMMCGAFSLAPIGWMAIGAYAAALGATRWMVGGFEALLIALAVAALLGPVVMLPVRRISGLYFALVSLAFVLVIQSVVSHLEYTGGALGIFGVPLDTDLPVVVAALVLSAAAAAFLSSGRRGRALRAAGQDAIVAQAMGVDVFRLQLAVGAVGAVIAAASGFLYAGYIGYVDPTQFGFSLVVQIIVMVIVGGRGSWVGAIIGACFITMLPLVLRPLAEWRDVFNGALLIAVVLLLPGGLVEMAKLTLRRARPAPAAALRPSLANEESR
ncbi:MAG: branched-chain amino acid ABC transporter permease [Rhizobiaceae bacterium]